MSELLARVGVESARLDAQILLCFALQIERAVLYAYPERTVDPAQLAFYRALLARRAQHEPIAYITGKKEFYGREFQVNANVLIPRPETELLVELALTSIRLRLAAGQLPVVADIGTGSGAIPVTIAVEEPRLPSLYACDISPLALEVAQNNARLFNVIEHIHFVQGHLATALPVPVDLLLANLPYVGTEEIGIMTRDVLDYEPHLALFSGPDGLDLLSELCTDLYHARRLNPGSELLLEIGYQQGQPLTKIIQGLWPAAIITIKKDYAGFDRLVVVKI